MKVIKHKGRLYTADVQEDVGTMIMDIGAVYGNLRDALKILKQVEKKGKELNATQVVAQLNNLRKILEAALRIPRPLGSE